MKAVLVLEDGTYYTGESFGATGETCGEVVFNTSMTGYQEVTTDPSYNGQIVTMTYPLIGNYGFNDIDNESYRTHVEGFIVKELCSYPNNWRNNLDPDEYFKKHDIVGIKAIDTRALTQHIRQFGSMYGIISTQSGNVDILLSKLNEQKQKKRNLVMEVTVKEPQHIEGGSSRVVVLDCGVKQNIIRSLKKRDCEIYIVPADATVEEIMSYKPDGILISNGPGDPRDLPETINTVRQLIGKKPVFGICLGHQLLGLAMGLEIFKLKFGHHGGNHPVKDLINNRCYITSQNHNYAIANKLDEKAQNAIRLTHINVNDGTVEGFRHMSLPVLSIQYHPEAAPGPQDSNYIFDEFKEMMSKQAMMQQL